MIYENHRRITSQMQVIDRKPSAESHQKINKTKRLLRNTMISAVVSVCLGGAAVMAIYNPQKTDAVMSHLTAGFEYDETLGRLQFVNNILPESAMVFLSARNANINDGCSPAMAQIVHAWNQNEPWIEYENSDEVAAYHDGEIMTIVKNHEGEYTLRIMHENGYESVYSGLQHVYMKEYDTVQRGQAIGHAGGYTAFELRKDGLSVIPCFVSE